MKTVLLIGLGRFGRHIARNLKELKHQVMAVDIKEDRVADTLPFVTSAQIGDSTNKAFLETLGVRNFDLCIVAIGKDFHASAGQGLSYRSSRRRLRLLLVARPGCCGQQLISLPGPAHKKRRCEYPYPQRLCPTSSSLHPFLAQCQQIFFAHIYITARPSQTR